jgi:hypothetical protein
LPPPPLRLVIQAGLRGAFLLARGQPHGLMLVEDTAQGVLRSFWAAAICLPAFLALRLMAWSAGAPPARGVAFGLVAELVGYVFAWVGFALASLPMAQAAGRGKEWAHFLAAWNWGNVVQYLMLLALTVPAMLGLPTTLAYGLGLAAFGYALWLEWFIAKEALKVAGGRALIFVLLDLLMGVFIGGFVAKLTGG